MKKGRRDRSGAFPSTCAGTRGWAGEPTRAVARSMIESGLEAVLVDSPLGPVGIVTVHDVIEAVAGGADPDTCWAGEISRPAPRTVSSKQHPAAIGEEMAA